MQTGGPALEGALNCYGLTASRKLKAGGFTPDGRVRVQAENVAPEAHAQENKRSPGPCAGAASVVYNSWVTYTWAKYEREFEVLVREQLLALRYTAANSQETSVLKSRCQGP